MRSTLFSPVSLPVQNGIVVMQSNAHYAHLGPEKHFSSRFSSKRDSRFCRHWDWILRLTSVMCRARKRLTLQAKLWVRILLWLFLVTCNTWMINTLWHQMSDELCHGRRFPKNSQKMLSRNPISFNELSSRKIVFREFREMQTRDINVDPWFKRRKQREKNPWYPLLALTVTSYFMYEYFM